MPAIVVPSIWSFQLPDDSEIAIRQIRFFFTRIYHRFHFLAHATAHRKSLGLVLIQKRLQFFLFRFLDPTLQDLYRTLVSLGRYRDNINERNSLPTLQVSYKS